MLLTVDLGELADDCKTGDSIAVNGVCLTVARLRAAAADFDVSPETLAKSALSKLRPASMVNIERAIRANDRFGGHFVQGHIDGTAVVQTVESRGDFAQMKFTAPNELLDDMVAKGSVAVDGISLTIAEISQGSFSIAVIPETWNKTTLNKVRIGDKVNIETDIIVKAVKKRLEKILPQSQTLTAEKLKGLGF
jgi:riboflavin synthase